MCSGSETRHAVNDVLVNRIKALADNPPLITTYRELAPLLLQSLAQLGATAQPYDRLQRICGRIRDEDFLSGSGLQSLGAKRRGHHGHARRHRFEDFQSSSAAEAQWHDHHGCLPIVRPYVGYGPADLDSRLALERDHLRRRIAANDREAQFRNPFADPRPDIGSKVSYRIDICVVVHRSDENDPVAAPVLAGSLLPKQPASVGVLDLLLAVIRGVHPVFDDVKRRRRKVLEKPPFVPVTDDQVGVAEAEQLRLHSLEEPGGSSRVESPWEAGYGFTVPRHRLAEDVVPIAEHWRAPGEGAQDRDVSREVNSLHLDGVEGHLSAQVGQGGGGRSACIVQYRHRRGSGKAAHQIPHSIRGRLGKNQRPLEDRFGWDESVILRFGSGFG